MDFILNLSNIYKFVIEVIIFIGYILLFSQIYRILITNISQSVMMNTATDYLSLMKMFNRLSLFIIFCVFVFFNASNDNVIFIVLEFLLFGLLLFFGRSSIKLMEHVVNFMYDPGMNDSDSYYCLIGNLDRYENKYVLTYFPGLFEIDITPRVF